MPAVSVIVRARDKASTIEATLRSIRAQTVGAELLVVDSGSTDGTLAIARRHADRVLEVAPEAFSYGGALNLGAREATAPVLAALSAHCVLARADWLESGLRHFERSEVAAATGGTESPDHRPLTAPLDQTLAHVAENPYWGFSNHASLWRAAAWRDVRFDETLGAAEDKAWAVELLRRGWAVVFDPALAVGMRHRSREGPRSLFRRARREARAVAGFSGRPPLTPREALSQLWHDAPPSRRPQLVMRMHPFRMIELAGRVVGERDAARS